MKKLVCAALILGTLITPACLYSDKVSAAPYTDPGSYAADEVAMPNCIGYQFQQARDGLPEYFAEYGTKANVSISFVENTDVNLAFTVKDQSVQPESGVKVNSSIDITLYVYSDVSSNKSEKAISDFVDNLYSCVLGRDADPDGAKYWKSKLTNFEMNGAQVAENFVMSEEFTNSADDEQFIKVLYKAFFNREPDADGFAYWKDALDSKTLTRKEVEQSFVYSKEWADTCASYGILSGCETKGTKSIEPNESILSFVERMYTKALNRESDPEGKAYWASSLANYDCTGEYIALAFFDSAEMKDYGLDNEEYVKRLYSTFMDREPDAEGFAYWVGVLNNGTERTSVVRQFADSAEFADRCVEARILPC